MKYIKKQDYAKKGRMLVEHAVQQGQEQLLRYAQAKELQGRERLRQWVLVFVGEKCVEQVSVTGGSREF